MKQARKMYACVLPSAFTVTRVLVEVPLIWMIYFAFAISDTGIEADEHTSPMMNFTLS
jgi:hypothetical protein